MRLVHRSADLSPKPEGEGGRREGGIVPDNLSKSAESICASTEYPANGSLTEPHAHSVLLCINLRAAVASGVEAAIRIMVKPHG